MVPPLPILDDSTIDYGGYAGQAGRTGPVSPLAPYPDVNSPPIVVGVSPATGLAAGGDRHHDLARASRVPWA